MGKHEKLLDKVLRGRSDANIPFEDLRALLMWLGFEERVRGSHHQKPRTQAKPYQVRQVRAVILQYHLAGNE